MSTNSLDPSTSPLKKVRCRWRTLGISLSTLATVILIVGIGIAFNRLLNANKQLANAVLQLNQKVNNVEATVILTQEKANMASSVINELNEIKVHLADLSNTLHSNKDKWQISEANNLVILANNNIEFAHNLSLAIKLLEFTDKTINKLNSNNTTELRQALAIDLSHLKSIPVIDTIGIFARLRAIDYSIDKLTFPVIQSIVTPTEIIPKKETVWWRRGLTSFVDSIRQIVVIRYNPSGPGPLMTPDQKIFLNQNLHALISTATLGLLQTQNPVYQASLQQASEWIHRYYMSDSPITVSLLAEIAALQKINIDPPIPSLTNSLQAFQHYLDNIQE